jgi:16S rRNA (guanine527-N7)-methyltransferase
MTAIKPSFANLVELFKESGLSLSSLQYELFWSFDQLLRSSNRDRDLTRITNFENTVVKHYIDCALVARLVELPSPLLDIGSGAGFPGIPIKIMNPSLHVILSEGRARRAAFLMRAIKELGLEGIEVYPHKTSGRFGLPVSGVVTRAFESAAETLRRVSPFLPEAGSVILMKGPNCDDEIREALSLFGGAFDLSKDLPYTIPGTSHMRRLLLFKRKDPSSLQTSPRGLGMGPDTGSGRKGARGPKLITSEDNDFFKTVMSLHSARGVRKEGLALVSGERYVNEILRDFPGRCEALIRPADTEAQQPPDGVERVFLAPELFRKADLFGTNGPLLIIRVEPMEMWDGSSKGCVLALAFQDPANVGAVIRTAAAFGVREAVILKEAAHPFHPRSIRAAGSAVMRIRLLQGPAINDLPMGQLPHVLLSPEGQDISDFVFPGSFCLVPGLEGRGLPQHLRSMETVSIPMERGVESLNAAVATSIALYCWRRQMKASSGRAVLLEIEKGADG